MAEIIKFKPASEEATQNFADFIDTAKTLLTFASSQIQWSDETWDLTGFAKAQKISRTPRIHFTNIPGSFGQYGRAFVAYEIFSVFGKPPSIEKFERPLCRLRDLAAVAEDMGITNPIDLIPEVLDRAMNETIQNTESQGGIKLKQYAFLKLFSNLEENHLLQVPFRWRPQNMPSDNARRRIDPQKSGRSLTEVEIDAIAKAFRTAKEPKDILIISILVLLCCAPARIGEVFLLPSDVEVLPHPGDGLRAGIRWRPKKGAPPQIKFIPEAMVPIAQDALTKIREVTEPARQMAQLALNSETFAGELPKDFPIFDPETDLTYDKALCVFLGRRGGRKRFELFRLSSTQFDKALKGRNSIFQKLGIFGPNGETIRITSHMARHYLNTIANKTNVPQADIALWSGRKLMSQNTAYDHETVDQLVERIRLKRTPEKFVTIPFENQRAFDISTIKETAHTTQFGWCMQSLRQNPCQMFGKCLNCTQLVCVKGAAGKLKNIKAELDRERELREKAYEKLNNGLRINDRWFALYEIKIERLEQLVAVMESDDVADGSLIRLADAEPEMLPQFDMTAFGKDRIQRPITIRTASTKRSIKNGD